MTVATPPSRVEPLNQSGLSTEAIIAIVGVVLAVLVPITGFLVRKIMLRPVAVTQLQYTAIDDDVDEGKSVQCSFGTTAHSYRAWTHASIMDTARSPL